MQNVQWSLQDAKNKFSEVVNAADTGIPQIVTRRGIPTAVVLSVKEFEQYQRWVKAKQPSLTEYLLDMPTDDGGFERLEVKLRDVF
jgi:antitoxin Phd